MMFGKSIGVLRSRFRLWNSSMARRQSTKATIHAENIVHAARKLLSGDTNFLEGIRELVGLGYEPNRCDHALGFEFFHWLNRRTSHMPSPEVRASCAQAWLAAVDAEMTQIESSVRDCVYVQCHALISRFEPRA
jgi:hypothetical protein